MAGLDQPAIGCLNQLDVLAEAAISRATREIAFCLHRGPRCDTRLECLKIGVVGHIDFCRLHPPRDNEQVRIGNGELIPEQILAACELPIEQRVALAQEFHAFAADFRRGPGAEKRALALVDLAGDVVERLLQPVARKRSIRGREPGAGNSRRKAW
jgi:hypothetical protein